MVMFAWCRCIGVVCVFYVLLWHVVMEGIDCTVASVGAV